jgi:HlyD family secretion protein
MNKTMNRFHFKPLTLALLAASLLALAGISLVSTRTQAADAPKTAAASKATLSVSLVQAKSGQLPVKLSANGGVAAWQEASVGSEASGLRVAELHVGVGDSVKRGQILATFASESVQADVALARASLNEAQANAADALANGDRARSVQGTGAISAQQINQYLTQEATARARVESAKAQLDAQLLRLKQTQLLAPDSGIISARNASVGAVVGAGTEMFKLIRQGRLEWRGEVTSAEFSRIRAGMAVLITSPGGVQAKGKVRMLAPTVDAATRNGLVYVDLTGAATPGQTLGAAFKPGMYAHGEYELGSTGALTVPQTAVVVRDGFSYVYRVGADNKVSQRKVQTGRVVGDQIEIQSGVKPDDKLVASGGSFLSEGDTVKVVTATPLAKPAQEATK